MDTLNYLEKAKARHGNESRKDLHKLTALMKSCDTVNDFYIVKYLMAWGPTTRGELVKSTGIKWTTAHDSLERLYMKGVLGRQIVKKGRGRPLVLWNIRN